MNSHCIRLCLLGLLMAVVFHVAPAQAQTRTWVSGVGDDANPCSRTAPCKTWPGAISKTAAGGEIDALDPGGFGTVTITKAITLDGGGGQVASILSTPGVNGINVSAGAGDTIILRNLRINGAGGTTGVQINTAARVIIEKCDIFGFASAGIYITPSSGSIQVKLQDVTLNNNHRGIWSQPSGGATVNATVEHIHSDQNTGGGILIDGTNGGASTVSIANSSVSANGGNGVNAQSGASGNVAVDISGTIIANNVADGVQSSQASGGTSVVTVGNSMLSYNGTAWNIVGGASLLSFKNNQVTGPTGTPPSPASFQ
jgi:hypothetical protein